MQGKVLVIRGGALGDFILTLPAIHLIRDTFPEWNIEILGYKRILSIAEKRFYANQTRSIEYGPLARFFSKDTQFDAELSEYFAGFHLIFSYLFDPDGIFHRNLARVTSADIFQGPGKLTLDSHAAEQLAKPLEKLALFLEDPAAKVYPNEADLREARTVLPSLETNRVLCIHPGSGSPGKNWPPSHWKALLEEFFHLRPAWHVCVLTGEADAAVKTFLETQIKKSPRVSFLHELPLTTAAAIFSLSGKMAGHDSGMSHLAAAAGSDCLLLFGPTDPGVWAPKNPGVRLLESGASLDRLPPEQVLLALLDFCPP